MFEHGFVKVGVWRGVPVRLHWTAPLGAFLFGGLRIAPAVWFAFFTLVIIHELGHASLVRRYGHHVMAVDVTGFGGLCRWVGSATTYERAAIAWGGVLAQAVLLTVAFIAYVLSGPPRSEIGRQLVSGFVFANFWLIVLNLLPFPPFDGAEAWPLARLWFNRWRGDRSDRRSVPPLSRRSSTPSIPPSRASAPPSGASVPPSASGGPQPGSSDSSSPPGAKDVNGFVDFLRRVAAAAGEARRGSTSARPRSR